MAVELNPLPPREAIEYFRSKGLASADARFSWQDIWLEEHARSFVVAKAMEDDLLHLFHDELAKALSEGTTEEQFISSMTNVLKAKGWWGRSIQQDPLTGETKEVQLGSRHRLRTIFDTNMRTSYAAGRWARIQRTKAAFPYLEYRQIDRPSARDAHKPYDGLIRPVDDPVWEIIYPPNGWFCGCSVRQVNDRMLRREGKTVSDPVDLATAPYTNPRSGQVDDLPEGIDPGFSSNPGMSWLKDHLAHDATKLDLPDSHLAFDRGFTTSIRQSALRDGDESLVMYDLAKPPLNGSVIGMSRSKPGRENANEVAFTDDMLDAVESAENQIVAIHSHPSSSSLSGQDIEMMAYYPGLAQIVAVGPDGSYYRAGRTDRTPQISLGGVHEASRTLKRGIQQAVNSGEMSIIDANSIHSHILMEALNAAGFITYAARPSGRIADAILRNASLIETLVSLLRSS